MFPENSNDAPDSASPRAPEGWKDPETPTRTQLSLPGFAAGPTVAERAFLNLARQWRECVVTVSSDCPLPHDADEMALSCLLLAVEWGREFTTVAHGQAHVNREQAESRGVVTWFDELPWSLCFVSHFDRPRETHAVRQLAANLDHHNSSIRRWTMEIGWMAWPWLERHEALSKLFANLANTLGHPLMAVGLACRFFSSNAEFWTFARSFEPPEGFAKQYQDRLAQLERIGLFETQTCFWKLEADCRRRIGVAALDLRYLRE